MTKTTDELLTPIKEIELPPGEYKINGDLVNVEHTFIVRTPSITVEELEKYKKLCGVENDEYCIVSKEDIKRPAITVEELEKIIDECEMIMSRTDHQKKHCDLDGHTTEWNHQDGRWHAANDIREYVQAVIERIRK